LANPDGVTFYGRKSSCFVVDDSDKCLNKDEADKLGGGSDITTRWIVLVTIGFVYSIFILIKHCSVQRKVPGVGAERLLPKDFLWSVIWLVTMLIFRVIRSGRIASGGYCPENEACTSELGYMPWTSNLILAWVICCFVFIIGMIIGLGKKHGRGKVK